MESQACRNPTPSNVFLYAFLAVILVTFYLNDHVLSRAWRSMMLARSRLSPARPEVIGSQIIGGNYGVYEGSHRPFAGCTTHRSARKRKSPHPSRSKSVR